jgi:hypothetical protein
MLAVALPLIGLVSLLLRSQLDPHLENYRLHFVLFGVVGTIAFVLGFAGARGSRPLLPSSTCGRASRPS